MPPKGIPALQGQEEVNTIDIIVFDGVDEFDVVGLLEVLRSAAQAGADLAVRLVSLREPLDVRGAHGLALQADSVYQPGADVVIVPGGGWRDDWLPILREAADSGAVMAGVRTGVMLLARAGVVGDGDLVTAGGVTSSIDLGLRLVERFAGPEFAEREAARLQYPWTPRAPRAESPHPPPPGHRITTEKVDGLVTATWEGEVVAESGNALLLRESGLAPVFYFPMEDVRMDLLSRTDHRTRCPFKGDASYWSIQVGYRRSDDIAWAYEDPLPGRSDIQGRIAFYADRLDSVEVGPG
jgi:uncharacterized protein (DUF427 family)